MENKIMFNQKDVTLNPLGLHGSKQNRLDRQIATVLISFSSFFKLENARVVITCGSN